MFGKNSIIYLIGNISIRASSFLLIPLYINYLSVEDYGKLEIILVTIQILLIFMGFGIPSGIIRFYSENQKKNTLNELIGTSFFISIFSMLIIGIFFIIFSYFCLYDFLIKNKFGIIIIILTGLIASFESLVNYSISIFRAKNKAFLYTLYSFFTTLMIIIFSILFITILHWGLLGAINARFLGFFIIANIVTLKVINFSSLKVTRKKIIELFSYCFPIIFAASAWFILEASDKLYLANFVGMQEVGVYALGCKLTLILMTIVVVPFQLAYSPYIFSILDNIDVKRKMSQLFTYLIFTLIFLGHFIVVFSRPIINFIASYEFRNAYLITIFILPSVGSIGIIYWASVQLHITKKTKFIAYILIGSAIINLLLNYVLVPKYGWVGAVIATNLSFFIASVLFVLIGQINYWVPFEVKRLLLLIVILISLILIYLLTFKQNIFFCISINLSFLLFFLLILYLFKFFKSIPTF